MIAAFAEVTGDRQFIHTEPDRTAAPPFADTIAHGFLTLSSLAPTAQDALRWLGDGRVAINYGFDRLRFVAPVPAGAWIRARFVLVGQADEAAECIFVWDRAAEIENVDRPALVARWINRPYHEESA